MVNPADIRHNALRSLLRSLACLLMMLASAPLRAETIQVAVASNFAAPMKAIAREFEKSTGHRVQMMFGSSGKLYAQIVHGAPFQVFLSADSSKPERLEQEGHALAGTRFTYARGALVLWSARADYVDNSELLLKNGNFRRLAIANDRLAPYGMAAREVLEKIDAWPQVKGRLVTGENIAQTYQFVASGNADIGFIAQSQAMSEGRLKSGSAWLVPQTLHAPILQDAVLLEKGRDHAAATALLDYLRSDAARALIRQHGYHI
jgi:molybdate transport system substrate-binding protein